MMRRMVSPHYKDSLDQEQGNVCQLERPVSRNCCCSLRRLYLMPGAVASMDTTARAAGMNAVQKVEPVAYSPVKALAALPRPRPVLRGRSRHRVRERCLR